MGVLIDQSAKAAIYAQTRWYVATDEIFADFAFASIRGKAEAVLSVIVERFQISRSDAPLLGSVSRLLAQPGLDLLHEPHHVIAGLFSNQRRELIVKTEFID